MHAKFKPGFVEKIGGSGQYDAIGSAAYNKVLSMDIMDILNVSTTSDYYNRIVGAKFAYSSPMNITNGAYVWNATSQKNSKDKGFNWRAYDRGAYSITATIGKTTFFKYSNEPNKWP